MMCAIEAGKHGQRVAVLAGSAPSVSAKNPDLRRRTLQLHQLHCRPAKFIAANPHFARSALARHMLRN
jgi:predicted flavoprotein YhiN